MIDLHTYDGFLALAFIAPWGLRILFYGDSLTAGAPSMISYAEEFCRSLTARGGCHVEGTLCGLCAATARQMLEIAEEAVVLDSLQSRWGSGISCLARKRKADLVLIMAGTNDLPWKDGKRIFESIQGLHTACHSLGIPTIALGIPDSGGRSVKRYGMLPENRRKVNSLLSSWVKESHQIRDTSTSSHTSDTGIDLLGFLGTYPMGPETFVNSVALMPFGPRSRSEGYWESDGTHFTASGAKTLGHRLAELLRPMIHRSFRFVPEWICLFKDYFDIIQGMSRTSWVMLGTVGISLNWVWDDFGSSRITIARPLRGSKPIVLLQTLVSLPLAEKFPPSVLSWKPLIWRPGCSTPSFCSANCTWMPCTPLFFFPRATSSL